jgi:hypothetical protein
MALDETIPFPCGADEKEEEEERRYETINMLRVQREVDAYVF